MSKLKILGVAGRAWTGKAVAVMGASTGNLGSARAQYHLRQVFVFLNVHDMKQPEVMISNAAQKFDPQGKLTDEATGQYIQRFLASFAAYIKNIQQHSH